MNSEIKINLPAVNKGKLTELLKVSKEDIQRLLEPVGPIVKNYHIDIASSTSFELTRAFHGLGNHRQFLLFHKEVLAKLYLSLTSDINNIYCLCKDHSVLRKLWLRILQSEEITSSEMERYLGRDVEVVAPAMWAMTHYIEAPFSSLHVVNVVTPPPFQRSKIKRHYTFGITPLWRKVLLELFLGKDVLVPKVWESLPTDKEMVVESFEDNIISDLTFLSGLAMTGVLTKSSGTLTAARINSIKKKFSTLSFTTPSGSYPLDRVELLANAYSVFHEHDTDPRRKDAERSSLVEEFGKFITQIYPIHIGGTRIAPFIPSFKGFLKIWAEENMIRSVVEIVTSLIQPAAKGWMSMENFKLRFLSAPVRSWSTDRYNGIFGYDSKRRHSLKRRSEEDNLTDSRNINWFREIDFPFIIHWIRFLCACGILEIAYSMEKGDGDDDSESLENIEYIRFTALGRYIYGHDKEYKPNVTSCEGEVEVDEKNSIITLSSASSPYTFFLSQVTEKISSTRFKVTSGRLMKGCESEKEVVDRINSLIGIIGEEGAEKLKTVLEVTRKRVHCLMKIRTKYILLRLRTDVPGLNEFIIKNKEIRSKVILCEKSMILVEDRFYEKVKDICSQNGYLLSE